jgi:glycosyltransferase involved in cell wall biosynthesis
LPEPLQNLPRIHPATWQRVLLDELRPLRELNLHVIPVRKQFPRHYTFDWEGVTFHCLKVPGGMRTLSFFWWETLLLGRCLRHVRPDMVHAWGTERGAALVASRLGYPYLVTMQGLLEWYSQQVRMGRVQEIEALLEPPSLRRATVVTTESTFGVRWLSNHYPHLEIHQAEHAPNWLFHQLQRRPETAPLRFLFIGVITRIKGTDLLLRALDRLLADLDFRLTIVGSGEPAFVNSLKSATSPALWERIDLLNHLTPPQIADELSRACIMLFPTRADTSPNSVKEAVVAGLPVVASALGGIVDYVHPGRNGLTFPAGDLEKFIGEIRKAVAHPLFGRGQVDPETLAKMREYLSPRVMREKFLAAYKRVMERAQDKAI